MRIVLDSNIICADFQLRSGPFRVLFAGLSVADHSLHIPAVVFEEVKANYERKLRSVSDDVAKVRSDYRRVTGNHLRDSIDIYSDDIEQWAREYESRLTARLRSADAVILPYPDVSHESLTRRALLRKRPFSEHGRGYRDSLIWETALSLAAVDGAPIALITGNTKDFADGEGQLHPDLAMDLRDRAISPEGVALFSSLGGFVDERVIPSLESVTETDMHKSIRTGAHPWHNLGRQLSERLVEMDVEVEPTEVGLPAEASVPIIIDISELGNFQAGEIRRMSPGEFIAGIRADAKVTLQFLVYKPDLLLKSRRDLMEFEALDEWNPDWSDEWAYADEAKRVHLALRLVLNVPKQEVVSVEVRHVSAIGTQRVPRRGSSV